MIALLVLVLLAAFLFRQFRWKLASSSLQTEVDRARSYGIPFTAAELVPFRDIPASENAATILLPVGVRLANEADCKKAVNEIRTLVRARALDRAALTNQLSVLTKDIEAIHQAAAKKSYYVDRDYDLGVDTLFPDLAQSKTVINVLCADAELKTAEGNIDAALKDLEDARRLTLLQNDEPLLIPLLVVVAEQAIITRTVERCLTLSDQNATALEGFTKFEEVDYPMPSLWRAMQGEAYCEIATIRNLTLLGGERMFQPGAGDDNPTRPVDRSRLQRDGLPQDDRERALLSRLQQHWNNALAKAAPTKDGGILCNALSEEGRAIDGSSDPLEALDKVLLPVFGGASQVVVQHQAEKAATAALGRVLLFRQSHGKWPATLSEAGVTSQDPFGGAPLHLKTDGDKVSVYSIGPDLRDEGGVSDRGGSPPLDDIAAYYPSYSRPQP